MRSATLLFAVLALTVYGQLVIKASSLAHATEATTASGRLSYIISMLTDIGVLSGLAAAIVAGICWILAIQRLELGFAYPFMALSFVLVPIGSTLLFGESLPPLHLLGLAFIVAGVTVSALAR
jgi:multidrug transporter EmrE-like cation transporter